MERIKVCFVKFNNSKSKKIYLFEMPWDSYLGENDTVIVPDVEGNEQEGTVVDTDKFRFEYESDKREFDRLLGTAGVEMPLKKVLGKVERTYFKWEGAENEDDD